MTVAISKADMEQMAREALRGVSYDQFLPRYTEMLLEKVGGELVLMHDGGIERQAELRGMQRMLSLVVQSHRKDYPTIVGNLRRVIEAASENAVQH